jgi:hypothetical protein
MISKYSCDPLNGNLLTLIIIASFFEKDDDRTQKKGTSNIDTLPG